LAEVPAHKQPDSRRRVQRILEELEQLPTLSSIAVRLLEATSSDESSAKEVVELVSADPSLSSKVLRLVRRASYAVPFREATIERAVKLLGFDEVRAAALSVEVFELLDGMASKGGEMQGEGGAFSRVEFWRHCLAAGAAAETIAARSPLRSRISPGEAFLAGLLHDLGQLAFHVILPKTFDRICSAAALRGGGIDAASRALIGMDTHTIGRRLAQHWQLPQQLVEAIWLNGQPPTSLPESEHRDLILLVTLADLVAQRQHLAHAGHDFVEVEPAALAESLGLSVDLVDAAAVTLHQQVCERAALLGLGTPTNEELLRSSIDRANALLASMQAAREQQATTVRLRSRALRAVRSFHHHAAPGSSITVASSAIIRSAEVAFGEGVCAILHPPADGENAELFRLNDGAPHRATLSGAAWPDEAGVNHRVSPVAPLWDAAPWLPRDGALGEFDEPHALRLTCGAEVEALLIRSGGFGDAIEPAAMEVLAQVWGAGLAAATLRERAASMGDRLVEVNRRLVEAQESLAAKRAMAAVGELACGAAHEMNNPLTVISGRSQILRMRLSDPKLKEAADEVARASHRLSDLITSLKMQSEAIEPKRRLTNLFDLVSDVVREVKERVGGGLAVRVTVAEGLQPAMIDREQMTAALRELVQNAHEAAPGKGIEVRVQTDPLDDRLMILVIDSGPGLSEKATAHAFDPFFSEKPAGRQPGLGLSRARRLIEANRGELSLKNGPEGGVVATVALCDWRGHDAAKRDAAKRDAA